MVRLNDNQLKQLADFTSNLGLVFLATVITPLFTNVDKVNILAVVWAVGASIICLVGSLLLHVERGNL